MIHNYLQIYKYRKITTEIEKKITIYFLQLQTKTRALLE